MQSSSSSGPHPGPASPQGSGNCRPTKRRPASGEHPEARPVPRTSTPRPPGTGAPGRTNASTATWIPNNSCQPRSSRPPRCEHGNPCCCEPIPPGEVRSGNGKPSRRPGHTRRAYPRRHHANSAMPSGVQMRLPVEEHANHQQRADHRQSAHAASGARHPHQHGVVLRPPTGSAFVTAVTPAYCPPRVGAEPCR